MKFHPILFSTEMVQAILEGRKTQTRRVVKIKGTLPNCETHPLSTHECGSVYHFWGVDEVVCPFGSPGDILWVRETFRYSDDLENPYDYKCDFVQEYNQEHLDFIKGSWKPSIFMPKEACRIFLKIKSIKVERLQDISEEDAIAEGINRTIFPDSKEEIYYFYPCGDLRDDSYLSKASTSFYSLWKKINSEESWKSNPWVWVIEFERTEKPENFE